MVAKKVSLLADMEHYFLSYLSMPTDYAFVCALWTFATYCWPHFDSFAYLIITSATKRSGKTLLSELIGFMASNSRNMSGMTPATVFRMIRDEHPTMIIDEAESLSGRTASPMRSVLNVGYRRGQTIPRLGKGGVIEQWPVYCPKIFILIGDVYDTLRDRSIILRMRRGDAPQRYLRSIAEPEGNEIGTRAAESAKLLTPAIAKAYLDVADLSFLPARDAEIWTALFAVATVIAPERLVELRRVAVDIATEKTQDSERHSAAAMQVAEDDANAREYGERLLLDLRTAIGKEKCIYTHDVLPALFAIDIAPWRKYNGKGLDADRMAFLLKNLVQPKLIRSGSKGTKSEKVARGYSRTDVLAAIEKHGLKWTDDGGITVTK